MDPGIQTPEHIENGSPFTTSDHFRALAKLNQHSKIQNSTFTATGPLSFLQSWTLPVQNPSLQLSSEAITGYREVFDLGVSLRARYPDFFSPGGPVHVFANDYPRVIETAQNFLRAYLGVNASQGPVLGTVFAVNSTGSSSALGNSLAPSDLCPNYHDDSGANQTTIWGATYNPATAERLQKEYITSGYLNITAADVATMQYLCGFETAICGTVSPFCHVFTAEEFRKYEYFQDLRYYYGNGPGSDEGKGKYMMFPFLASIADMLDTDTYSNSTGDVGVLQPLTMAFLNDGQISQLVAQIGVFDDEPALPSTYMPDSRKYVASRFVSMRGTVAFERLSCGCGSKYLRVRLNDAVYPIPACQSGPGRSCPVAQYKQYVEDKYARSGGFLENCGANTTATESEVKTDFWTKYAQYVEEGWIRTVTP
ncbi:hypothetical protein A1O1_08517 [Capronia coronata CBS 617.96]|uniref:Acid phosphatase n=1 Tax=Capronia coronata CBS 617.96 TaxID=1182541 RepID=W9XJM4_9EURO|nr:uncharacterized protein A1O1_08517 [Capronia coronata CBS 617.96]EXJ80373.1 hypothetical protein A1O1_08517 [Capronia coronata CBS 617.96]